MAVPKRKVSPSRRNKRRANDALTSTGWQECSKCGEMKLPHNVCRDCGHYNDKEIVVAKPEIEEDAA